MTRRVIIFGGIYVLSFVFLIIHLNFNVKTFRLTQDLQAITLQIYEVSNDLETKELLYYSRTNPDEVYRYVTENLGMIRQEKVQFFTNEAVDVR